MLTFLDEYDIYLVISSVTGRVPRSLILAWHSSNFCLNMFCLVDTLVKSLDSLSNLSCASFSIIFHFSNSSWQSFC